MWQNIKMFYRWPEKVEHIFQFHNSIFIYALCQKKYQQQQQERANYNSFSCFPSIFRFVRVQQNHNTRWKQNEIIMNENR